MRGGVSVVWASISLFDLTVPPTLSAMSGLRAHYPRGPREQASAPWEGGMGQISSVASLCEEGSNNVLPLFRAGQLQGSLVSLDLEEEWDVPPLPRALL